MECHQKLGFQCCEPIALTFQKRMRMRCENCPITHWSRSSSVFMRMYTGLPLSCSMRSSAIRNIVSIISSRLDLPLSRVSSGIGKMSVGSLSLKRDARLALFFDSCFLPHPFPHTLSLYCLYHPLAICRFLQPALQGFLLRLAHMDFESSGLLSTELLDERHLTSELLCTPTSSHSLFNRNASLLSDRMRDTHMTPDSSPMVSAPTIVCASISSFYPFRTCCPLRWSFALAVHQMNSCWPAGMPPTSNRNL